MTRSNDEPPRHEHDDVRGGDSPPLDPGLRRAVDVLRRLPTARADAVERIVAAAHGEPVAPPLPPLRVWRARRRPRWSVGLAAAGVAALLLAGAGVTLAVRQRGGAPSDSSADRAIAEGADAALPVHAVSSAGGNAALDDAPLLVPFVLKLPEATRVSLVGDFNGWDPAATPLTPTGNGVWTVTVSLTPGRHAYGFVVDDSLWVRDPRAETERDADYGRDHSVVVVGRP